MAFYECLIKVKWDGHFQEVLSGKLVPGDIIEVPRFIKMPCDAIMLEGMAVMNEAMLTGESIPVIKNELPMSDKDVYSSNEH